MSTIPQSPDAAARIRARGRACLWAGIALPLLGIVLALLQYGVLKLLFVPWYVLPLSTVGVLLLVCAVAQRRTVVRIVLLLLLGALAAFQWLLLVGHARLPSYQGPAQAGKPFPAFQTTLADGASFTDKDLHKGRATVLTFFRGRW